MFYKVYAPSPQLAPYVKCYWILRAPANPFHAPERLIPDGSIELIFNFGTPYRRVSSTDCRRQEMITASHVVGERTECYLIEQFGAIDHVAIRFKPGGLHPFVNVPVAELTQQAVEASLIFGSFICELEGRLFEAKDDQARINLLENFLLCQLNWINRSEPWAYQAVAEIAQAGGQGSIVDLAEQLGASYKQLERKFLTVVGLTPKVYSRISRFLTVFNYLQSSACPDWSSITFDCGYYDQAHFIKEFKHFTGLPPGQFFAQPNAIAEMLTASAAMSNFYNTANRK
jgi:AraC-like DNA-binding protein